MGIESENEPDDQEIFVSFKWFHSIHAVMRTRAVVTPPALLDTSSIVNQTTNNNNSDFDLDSEVEKMIEENNGQRGLDEPEVVEPASNLSGYLFETAPPTPTGPPSSATVAPAVSMNEPVTPVISSRPVTPVVSSRPVTPVLSSGPVTPVALSGPVTSVGSSRTASVYKGKEPAKKRRKPNKVEKMETAMKAIFDEFSMKQEKALKEVQEMEQKRMEMEERQMKREDERDIQFISFLKDIVQVLRPPSIPTPTVSTPYVQAQPSTPQTVAAYYPPHYYNFQPMNPNEENND